MITIGDIDYTSEVVQPPKTPLCHNKL